MRISKDVHAFNFFFIDLVPPQIYDKLIRKAGGICGIRRGKLAT
jgi:hypothetical protein